MHKFAFTTILKD